MPKILVTRWVPESAARILTEAAGREKVLAHAEEHLMPRGELLARARGVEALFTVAMDAVDAELMDAAGPQLRAVANWAVGYDNIDVPAATARGIAVCNTPGVLTEATAEIAWALLMSAARRTGEAERFLRAGNWKSWGPRLLLGVDLYEKTLGVFGLGNIGKAVARRARGFNMRVLYHKRTRLSAAEERALGVAYADKAALLAQSDFISLHCPMTPETRHAFGAPEFSAMKSSAVFVNTTRGPVVDEAALAHALKSGAIFAAGLDVYEDEPRIHPGLLACENAVLLPHIGSATDETRTRMAEMAANNIAARLRGKAPPNCVNPEVL